MHARRLALALALLTTASATRVHAQAWPQPLDGYYLKVSASFLSTEDTFDGDGDRLRFSDGASLDRSFREISLGAYLEYGLWKNFTLVARVPFKVSTSRRTSDGTDDSFTNGGLGDLWVSMRSPLVERPFVVSLQAGVKIPLGYEKEPDNTGPAIGTGEVDGELRLLFGQSLYPLPAYVSAGIGYRARGGTELKDEVTFGIEGGYTAGRVFVKLRFEGVSNTSAPADTVGLATVQPNARNEDVYKLVPEIDYHFSDNVAIAAELFHVLAGKNTMAGTTYAVGFVFKR